MNEIKTAAARRPVRLPRINDIAPAILLILASRASAIGMLPFGIAFFAAAFDKEIAYLGIVAVCIGTATSAGIAAVPKYVLAMVIYWLFTRVYHKKNDMLNSAVCGGSVLTGGIVMLLVRYGGMYDIFLLTVESVIASLMYIVFRHSRLITNDFSKRGGISAEEYISAAVCIGVIIAGLAGITIGNVRLCNVFAAYVVLVTALNASIAITGCTGLCIGFMCCMSSSDSVMMMGVYGMSAIFASFMNNYKRIGCGLGYICGAAITLIYTKNMYSVPMNMFEVISGVFLFVITPSVVQDYYRSFFNKSMHIEAVSPEKRMREYLSMRLYKAGEAFTSLYESFVSVGDGRLKKYSGDIGSILDETTERVCKGCNMCGKCWQANFRRTYKNVLELIGIIESEGRLTQENTPANFCEHCIRGEMFMYEINHVYELYKREVLRRADSVTARNLIASQYSELNSLFLDMSDEIDDGFVFREKEEEEIVAELDKCGIVPYEISVIEGGSGRCEVFLRLPPIIKQSAIEGVLENVLSCPISFDKTEHGLSRYISRPGYTVESAVLQLAREGAEANGDCITVFSDGRGMFFAIIADGMGSGSEARYESAAALRLLTAFLKAGFLAKTAIGILNSSLCLNMDSEMYSTIDLLGINLYNGESELYKIGSAQTIASCNDEIKIFQSVSAPAGIVSDISPDRKTLIMREGDVVVLMTDGITEAGYTISRTDWIKNIIIKPHDDMQDLAKEIMDEALKKNRGKAKDDMSVIALRVMGI